MAPKFEKTAALSRDSTVTVPMATFFKHVKVNGMDGTVTFHAGPHINMARAAWTAKTEDDAK
jgi:hypothetical protein